MVSVENFRLSLEKVGVSMTKSKIMASMKPYDLDQKGYLTFQNFEDLIRGNN